jgi:RNA recognition motif-containing protein
VAKKLFVGSLPWATTSDDLKEMFSKVGEVVSATVISDKFSGRSKGFGFVEMANDKDADKAIEELNGKELEGTNGPRKMVVAEARPREEGDRGERGGRGGWDRGPRAEEAPAPEAPAEDEKAA